MTNLNRMRAARTGVHAHTHTHGHMDTETDTECVTVNIERARGYTVKSLYEVLQCVCIRASGPADFFFTAPRVRMRDTLIWFVKGLVFGESAVLVCFLLQLMGLFGDCVVGSFGDLGLGNFGGWLQ